MVKSHGSHKVSTNSIKTRQSATKPQMTEKPFSIKISNGKLNIKVRDLKTDLKNMTIKQARKAIGKLIKANKDKPVVSDLRKVAGRLSEKGIFNAQFSKDIDKWTQGNKTLAKTMKSELFRNFAKSTREQNLEDKINNNGASLLNINKKIATITGGGRFLVGKSMKNGADLAALSNSLQDNYESIRVVYVKDGKIKSVDTTTQHVGDSVSLNLTKKTNKAAKKVSDLVQKLQSQHSVTDGDIAKVKRLNKESNAFIDKVFKDTVSIINKKAKRLGGADVYLMHNHPSGKSEPSGADEHLTALLAREVPNFKSHVVIGQNEFSILKQDKSKGRKEDPRDEIVATAIKEHTERGKSNRNAKQVVKQFKKLGEKIAALTKGKNILADGNSGLKMLATKLLPNNPNIGAINLVIDARGGVLASYEMSKDLFKAGNEAKLNNVLKNIEKLHHGYSNALLINRATKNPTDDSLMPKLIKQGKVIDAISFRNVNDLKSYTNASLYKAFQRSHSYLSNAKKAKRVD